MERSREATAAAVTVTDAAARDRPAGIPATGSENCRNRRGVYETVTARLMLEPSATMDSRPHQEMIGWH